MLIQKVFGPNNLHYVDDQSFNRSILKSIESYWNGVLSKRGYVFLIEVYHGLDINVSEEAEIPMGWAIEDGKPIEFVGKEWAVGILLNFYVRDISDHFKD